MAGFERSYIHRCIGFVFACAFVSLYVQWPGLYGWNGLLPADNYVSRIIDQQAPPSSGLPGLAALLLRFPCLGVLAGPAGVSLEGAFEFLMVLGASLGVLTAMGLVRGFFAYAVMWASYLSLFLAGHTFLSFQWDILLLETGLLSAVAQTHLMRSGAGPRVVQLLFRFVFWKLMFMAGVVKIQANCPTWLHLTALEYHFATQPLPSPLAWYAHQLPPLLLRLGVAGTLLVEIPLTFLSLAKSTTARRFSVVAQALLQISIILTGNYTFFNVLTLVLMVPVWERDLTTPDEDGTRELNRTSYKIPVAVKAIIPPVVACVTAAMAACILKVEVTPAITISWRNLNDLTSLLQLIDRGVRVDLSDTLHVLMKRYLPISGLVAGGAILLMGVIAVVRDILSATSSTNVKPSRFMSAVRRVGRAVRGTALLVVFAVYLYLLQAPLAQIESKTASDFLPPDAEEWAGKLKTATSPFVVSSGYGLFRVMTGVGSVPPPGSQAGVGGMPPSVVERPEIVLQGFDGASQDWKDIPFKHKPGDVYRRPTMVAPHQPRLDWQMWFAALGPYQHQPWLIALVDRLLHGGEVATDVISLLDENNYPFKNGTPPLAIRAQLFHYDFTRLNTSWTRLQLSIPNAPASSASSQEHSGILSPSNAGAWWSRKFVADYLPALEPNNPSVANFLGHYGIRTRPYQSIDDKVRACFESSSPLVEEYNGALAIEFRKVVKYVVCNSFRLRQALK